MRQSVVTLPAAYVAEHVDCGNATRAYALEA